MPMGVKFGLTHLLNTANRFTISLPIPEQPVEPSNAEQGSNHVV